MESLLRIYLPTYVLLYALLIFILPSYRIYQRQKINPIKFGKEDNAHDYIGLVMKFIISLIVIVVIIYSIFPDWIEQLGEISLLENYYFKVAGLILTSISFIWLIIAQYQMGKSWRIGIDQEHKTELVVKGVFSISRNPIFLGMIVSTLGIFMLIPNAFTFFTFLASYFMIQIQIRLEEEFLAKEHGSEYLTYKGKTKRLLFI